MATVPVVSDGTAGAGACAAAATAQQSAVIAPAVTVTGGAGSWDIEWQPASVGPSSRGGAAWAIIAMQ